MTDKMIEHKIREHYVAENGEWLVEKGKVKEAKLLKEACEAIERLRRANVRLDQEVYRSQQENWKKRQEIENRARDLEALEKRLQARLEAAASALIELRESLK